MIADSERREVARMIRHAWVNVPDRDPVRHHLRVLREIYEAVGINDGEADAIGLFDRLADLIEPSYGPTGECVNPLGEFFGEDCPYCEDDGMECFENEGSYYKDGVLVIDCGPCRHYHRQDTTTDTTKSTELATKCDRDALLAQVKELERCAWYFGLDFDEDEPLRDRLKEASEDFAGCARRIREALGVSNDE